MLVIIVFSVIVLMRLFFTIVTVTSQQITDSPIDVVSVNEAIKLLTK